MSSFLFSSGMPANSAQDVLMDAGLNDGKKLVALGGFPLPKCINRE